MRNYKERNGLADPKALGDQGYTLNSQDAADSSVRSRSLHVCVLPCVESSMVSVTVHLSPHLPVTRHFKISPICPQGRKTLTRNKSLRAGTMTGAPDTQDKAIGREPGAGRIITVLRQSSSRIPAYFFVPKHGLPRKVRHRVSRGGRRGAYRAECV